MCQAYVRLGQALRPCTASANATKFNLYLAFTSWHQLPIQDVDAILVFLEFLTQNGSRAQSLASYVSVLKHYFRLCDIDILGLSHRKIQLLIRSVSINSVYMPKFKANITIALLLKIVQKCDALKYGQVPVYKVVFLLAYFAFLRLSNVVPSLAKAFDVTRNLLRSDAILGPPGAHIILKWGKAMQGANSHQVVQIPALPFSPLCPVSAIKSLLYLLPPFPPFPALWPLHSHCSYGFGYFLKNHLLPSP